MLGTAGAFFTAAALLVPGTVAAQWTDAQLPTGGELQVGLSGRSETADRRFLPDGTTQSLVDAFSVELDPRLVPSLDSLSARLGILFGDLGLPPPEPSTLGTMGYDVLFERTRVPLSLRYGITDWLAPFIVVPFVRGKSFVSAQVDSLSASAGPASGAFGGADSDFFPDLAEAIVGLADIVAADTLDATRQAQAQALLADAQAMETGLLGISELEFAPTEVGANGQALQAFYTDLRDGFGSFEVDLPELALAGPVSGATAASFASGPAFGIETPANRDTGFKLGDIELGLSIQPVNTFRSQQPALLSIRGRLEALYRFATGSEPAANRISDVGTGDGQPDLEFRTAWDLALGRRFWVSASAAYNLQLEADIVRLLTDPLNPVQEGAFTTPVRWDPGNVFTLSAAPRFNLTPSITFSLLYRYRRRGRDEVSSVPASGAEGPFSPGDIEVGTEYETTSLGLAARFASTDWTGNDRRPALPLEVELRYLNTVSASDGIPLDTDVWELGVRYYPHLLR